MLRLAIIILVFTSACVPVLSKNLMQSGSTDVRMSELRKNPGANIGKLFILGGIIAKTTVIKEGSLIEAIYIPVNAMGYLKVPDVTNERFLAIYRGSKLLDPLIYREKREITLAGEFLEVRKGLIGEMEYGYPLFEIRQIHLWAEYPDNYYFYPPPYPRIYYRLQHGIDYDYPYYPYYPYW